MMMQINLLPEARIIKLKEMARKRFATTLTVVIGIIVGTIIITLLLLLGYMYSVHAANNGRIKSLKTDIEKNKDMEQQAATLQEHLATFSSLNSSRLYVSEIFSNLGNVIPADVTISSFQISQDYTVSVTGKAPSFAAVSVFAKALEQYNVNYKPQPNLERKPLFTDVNISSVAKDSGATSDAVSFSMTFKVDPTLFEKR